MQNTEALTHLALDLSWSWNCSADEIWKKRGDQALALGPVIRRIVWQKRRRRVVVP
jgi:hypothetical protein